MYFLNLQCSLPFLFLYSDFPYSTTNCHFPSSRQIDELCVTLDSLKHGVNHISSSHIHLFGLSTAAWWKRLASSEDTVSGYSASDKTAHSKGIIVQNWVTHAKFWNKTNEKLSWDFYQISFYREKKNTFPSINITSKTEKLKISYGPSTIPNLFQQATILVS